VIPVITKRDSQLSNLPVALTTKMRTQKLLGSQSKEKNERFVLFYLFSFI